MTRRYDRIEYSSGKARRFIIVPDTSFMSSYVNKYGSDVVFRFENFSDAMSLCGSGRGDEILFAPGAYTLGGSTLTVNKESVYIGPLSGNPNDVRIDASAAASADLAVFTIGATGDYCTIDGFTITGDDSTTPAVGISVTGPGCVIKNCTLLGSDTGAAVAGVGILDGGASTIVENCQFFDYIYGIDIGDAAKCQIKGNYIHSDNTSGRGINISGVASWSHICENVIHLGATTATKGIVVDNTALLVTLGRNRFSSDCDDSISAGSGGTQMYENTLMGETTAAWIVD